MNGGTRRGIDYAAWAAVLAVVLGAAFEFYGRFTALESRMDEADADRHVMMDALERIEQDVLTLAQIKQGEK